MAKVGVGLSSPWCTFYKEINALFEKDPSLENMLALRNTVSKYHEVGKQANTLWQGISSPYFGMDDLKWFSHFQ